MPTTEAIQAEDARRISLQRRPWLAWVLGCLPVVAGAVPVLDVPPSVVRLQHAELRVAGAQPGDIVGVVMARHLGVGLCPPGQGDCLTVRGDLELLDRLRLADDSGFAEFSTPMRGGLGVFYLQAVVIGAQGVRVSAPMQLPVLGRYDDDDGDGASNQLEFYGGTDPLDPDMDLDGVPDGEDLWPLRPSAPDTWVPDDVVASHPDLSMPDPEFDTVFHRVVWQDKEGEELWVGDVDPQTGLLMPQDGRGTLIDTDVVPIPRLRNGPEWVQTHTGAHVLYAKDGAGGEELMMAEDLLGAWSTSSLGPGLAPFGSLDSGDPTPHVYYAQVLPNGQRIAGTRMLGDPSSDRQYTTELYWGRWVEGGDRLLALVRDPDDVFQVVEVDPATGGMVSRTDTPTNKRNAFGWQDPESGREAWFVTRGPVGTEATLGIEVYLSDGQGGWVLRDDIRASASHPFIISPEPFVVGGRSYISFLASRQPTNSDNAQAEVWVVDIDPDTLFGRRVSLPTNRPIKDPEPAVFGDQAFVYYTEVVDERRVLHRCTTGL